MRDDTIARPVFVYRYSAYFCGIRCSSIAVAAALPAFIAEITAAIALIIF